MSTWTELVSAALVGTERRAFVADPAVGVDTGVDPAQALLQQAALAAIPALTGSQPAPYEGPLPEPAPADDRPLLPAASRLRLRAVVDVCPKYLGEWLAAVRAAGYRVPSDAMPSLLNSGRSDVSVRGDLAEVLGARGHWLARQNPDWRYLLREPFGPLRPEDWDASEPDARIAYATGLYATDPDAARTLIQAAWPTLTAAVKVSLLAVVARHATDADLPFLTGLAQDPSKQVREEAGRIATRLAHSGEDVAELLPEEFAAEIARLGAAEGFGADLTRLVTRRRLGTWPLDAARTLLALFVEFSRGKAAGQTSDRAIQYERSRNVWTVQQLVGVLADRAPLDLRPDVERVVQAQACDIAAGVTHDLDFTDLHSLLGFRADMHAELTASADAATGQE
jgi:hypothetical protein